MDTIARALVISIASSKKWLRLNITLLTLFFKSRVTPLTTNSLKKPSHASYYRLEPGRLLAAPCLISSFSISFLDNRNLRYYFNGSAPAPLSVVLMHFKGFPSMLILTRLLSRANLGLRSDKSLFDTLSVFNFLNSVISSGSKTSLLLCRSIIVIFGARSKFSKVSTRL